MKTDRRHELQTNALADWIGKHIQQSQGHGKTILAVLLLAAAAAIAGTYLAQDQAARTQASWNQFFYAFGERDPGALEDAAKRNQGSTAGLWAYLAVADLKLSEGIGDLYTNRDNAKQNLAEAEANYRIVDQAATEKLLRERAWFGLGQVYESMAEIEKAKQFYDKLASSSPTSALGKEAHKRSEALSDPATQKWYNWFANQTPRPPALPGMPDDLGLPDLPGDLENLSDRPDLSFPGLPPARTTPDETTPPANTDSTNNGPELNSPAPAKPDGEPAADSEKPESPSTGEPGTEPKPAEPTLNAPASPTGPAPAEPTPPSGDAAPE